MVDYTSAKQDKIDLKGPRLPFIAQTPLIVARPLEFLDNCAKKYGDSFILPLGVFKNRQIAFFSKPETLQQIFTASPERFEWGKMTYVFRPLTGSQSLIMLEGKKHEAVRRLLMNRLHGKQMYNYGQTIIDLTLAEIARFQVGSTVAIRDCMADISLDIILRVVFGINPGQRYSQLKTLIKPFLERVNSPLNSVQFFFSFLQQDWGKWSPWGKFLRDRQQIDRLIYAEIAERRQQKDLGDDILSLLLSIEADLGQPLNDEQLRDQLMTLLLLGHETTASALSWVFYWVHQDPAVLTRLKAELANTDLDPIAIAKLPYLNAVCQETLRINPIALISQPRLVKDAIELDGNIFNKGSILIPCIYLAHRRRETYPNPESFDPDRFIERKFSPYEYLPFGGGDRSCIGKGISNYQMKLVLATVLSQYRLELSPKHPVKPVRRGVTIVPSGDCKMIVKERLAKSDRHLKTKQLERVSAIG